MSVQSEVASLTKINEYWGDSESCFLVQLHCELIRAGEPGGEAFQVTVVSPEHLVHELGDNEIKLGRGYLLAREYDEARVRARLQRLVDGSGAGSWSELSEYIQKYFDWV